MYPIDTAKTRLQSCASLEVRAIRVAMSAVDRLRVCWLNGFSFITFTGSLGGVPREQKMLKGHLPRVIYHQEY